MVLGCNRKPPLWSLITSYITHPTPVEEAGHNPNIDRPRGLHRIKKGSNKSAPDILPVVLSKSSFLLTNYLNYALYITPLTIYHTYLPHLPCCSIKLGMANLFIERRDAVLPLPDPCIGLYCQISQSTGHNTPTHTPPHNYLHTCYWFPCLVASSHDLSFWDWSETT